MYYEPELSQVPQHFDLRAVPNSVYFRVFQLFLDIVGSADDLCFQEPSTLHFAHLLIGTDAAPNWRSSGV